MSDIHKVAVIGATGMLGIPVTQALVAAGYAVTALVRNAPSARRVLPPEVALVEADARDGARWRGVVTGGDFHEVTVATLACGAMALSHPRFGGRGVLPPSRVVGPTALFDALAPLGVTWRIGRIDTTRPSR